MERLSVGLSHLYMTIFLYTFSTFMVLPAITDVTMAAICPGEMECSLAIYLTGFQQAVTGVGTLVMMPLIGNLSDKYGRRALLTVPLTLSIIPLAILAYSRSRISFYVYYALKVLTSMLCEGSVHCLAFAYVADNIEERRRASAFGILTGIGSCAFVCGNIATRFLSTSSTFQVAAAVAAAAAVYMRIFLPESMEHDRLSIPILSGKPVKGRDADSSRNAEAFKEVPSFKDMLSLLKTCPTFTQTAVVAFFSSLAEVGFHASLMYYLKAKFHFNKDQFADLMVIHGVTGTISQLFVMPMLVPALGEEKLLSIGLFFNCAHMFLYGIAWSSWVPYAASLFGILVVFSHPCMRTIVSKQFGRFEQGKAQGCISGISSFANVVSPLTFSPLTALFLSERAPFYFPGFSIMCAGLASMISFIQSTMINANPPIKDCKVNNCNSGEA